MSPLTVRSRPRRLAAAALALAMAAGPAPAQSSIAPAIDRAARGLTHVSVLFQAGNGGVVRVERASSGVVIDASGLVLTNEHLVDEVPTGDGLPGGEYWLQVLIGGGRPCRASVVARDERLDLALLQLELEEGERVAALELAPAAAPAPGAHAFALGRPRGGQFFALAGVVAEPSGPIALREGLLALDEALITDAAVLTDVDGGPFLDGRGRVLGIVNTAERLTHDATTDEEELEEQPDYALVVSAAAIRRAFPERLGEADATPAPPPGADDATAAIVSAGAGAVVGVWAGADDARPARSAPEDPYAERPEPGLGSGVVVDSAGLVLTGADVVGEATEVGVRLLDGRTFRGQVLRALPEKRVALVQLALPEGTRLQAAELGSSDAALAGETVVVIGNPYGHTLTVSAGVLSALEVDERLRVGAWVHDGHKGGAVLDATGRLIGVPVADIFEGEDEQRARAESYLGVALPIDRVREWLAAELEQHGAAPGLTAAPQPDEADLARRRDTITEIVAATRDSLLNVEVKAEEARPSSFDPFATPGELKLLGQGSGVVIDESGLAITNWHVVRPTLAEDGSQRDDHKVEVTLPSGRRFTARVLATSRDDDLGLIQLELPDGERVQPVPLGASRPLRRGDVVVAIGNPYGKANTVTVGIVAAKDQDANIAGRLHIYQDMLQTDAAINPGNSGGALLDVEGRLVGINSAGRSGAGLAIPVERVREVFGQKLLATMGPFLGMTVADAPDGGVVVRGVEEHGPAAAAGVAEGDLVRAVDGRAVESAVDYGNALLAGRPAAAMFLQLERAGAPVDAYVRPIHHTAWRVFRQTGIELAPVDYRADSALVRTASVALHQAYTGLAKGQPSRLMTGALRVVQVHPKDARALDVRPGDLLLGASSIVRTVDSEHAQLVRFESLAELRDFLEPLAAPEGPEADCWLYRRGAVRTARVPVFKVR